MAGDEKMMTAEMWAITGDCRMSLSANARPGRFFYTGTYMTRRDAIDYHCRDLGAKWADRRRRGDRAVRVQVTEIASA